MRKFFFFSFLLVLCQGVGADEMTWDWHHSKWGEEHDYVGSYPDYWTQTCVIVMGEDMDVTNDIPIGTYIGLQTAYTYIVGKKNANTADGFSIYNHGGENAVTAGPTDPPNGWSAYSGKVYTFLGYGISGHGSGPPVLQTNLSYESSCTYDFTFKRIETYDEGFGTPCGYAGECKGAFDGGAVLTIHRSGYVTPPDYTCYFDLSSVTFFDGQENRIWTAKLYVSEDGVNFDYMTAYSHTESGYTLDSFGPYDLDLPDNLKKIVLYRWVMTGIYGDQTLGTWQTDSNRPDGYHYVVECNYLDLNTNSPYVPPEEPEDPDGPEIVQPPGYGDPYPPTNAPPAPWTNWPAVSPQWPPDYYPWPPDYPPPPPLTEWPTYPPDYWDYNNDNSNTNVVGPPQYDYEVNTNYSGDNVASSNMSVNDIYLAIRQALNDEGNLYQAPNPPNYDVDWTNDLLDKAQGVCDDFDLARGRVASNRNILIIKGRSIISAIGDDLQLPVSIGTKMSYELTWPLNDEKFDIDLTPYESIISVMRAFLKWIMYVVSFWIAFVMLRRALARSA